MLKDRLTRLIPAVARALVEAEQQDERRRAERAMCESEHKYRTLFESLGDAVFRAKAKDGKIIEANRRTGYLLQCFRTDIVGHAEDQFLALERNQTPDEDEPSGLVPGKLVRPDGAAVSVAMRTTRLKLHGDPVVLRLFLDLRRPSSP